MATAWFRGVPREIQPPDLDWPGPPHWCLVRRVFPYEAEAIRTGEGYRRLNVALDRWRGANRQPERPLVAGPAPRAMPAPRRPGAPPPPPPPPRPRRPRIRTLESPP